MVVDGNVGGDWFLPVTVTVSMITAESLVPPLPKPFPDPFPSPFLEPLPEPLPGLASTAVNATEAGPV